MRQVGMFTAWRSLRLMVALSVRADAPRSLGAVLTAVGAMAAQPLRVIGLALVTNGIVSSNVATIVTGVALIGALQAISRWLAWASFNIRMRLRENTQVYLDSYLMQLTAGIVGIEHHERPEYLDHLELIRAEQWLLANPFNPISWSLASLVQVATAFLLLVAVDPRLVLLPLAGVPAVAATVHAQRLAARLRDEHAEANRRLRHLQDLTTNASTAKEIRIYELIATLMQRRRDLFAGLERVRVHHQLRTTGLLTAAWLFFALCYIAALAVTIRLAVDQQVSTGAVVLVLGLGSLLIGQLAELAYNAAWLMRTERAVGKLLWLVDYAATQRRGQSAVEQPAPARLRDGIHFQNVGFTYPGTERPVIADVDLFLPAGHTVAIVGNNGAGKTTLAKLLCQLYEPTSGTVRIDGVRLHDIPAEQWRRRLAAGFQDFARLELLARESVGVGDLPHVDSDEVVGEALSRAAADDVRAVLPDGLDTQLGRSFEGGMDLSLGQWQKLAMGRAMMRQAPLVLILDEPTASLDAATEHALFERFAVAARRYAAEAGTITLLVSHRFSTVRMADLIVVISNGRIAEQGTHLELLAREGIYAELYGLQARAYA
jgi:ATP-binding cassette, subfamily B, bacterial